jgi:hypothetical protein
VGSAMEGLQEAIAPEARPALAVSTVEEGSTVAAEEEGSTVAEAATGVGVTDSSHEVIKP